MLLLRCLLILNIKNNYKIGEKLIKKTFENKRSVVLHGWKPGEKRDIKTDKEGTPLDFQTRRRVKDGDFKIVRKKRGGK